MSIYDFSSMYPSVMASCGISPECVDFIDHGSLPSSRFESVEIHTCWSKQDSRVHYVCVLYGLLTFDHTGHIAYRNPIPVAWYSQSHTLYDVHSDGYEVSTQDIQDMVTEWIERDTRCCGVPVTYIDIGLTERSEIDIRLFVHPR